MFLIKEFIKDWDELNIAFKALILIGLVLFIVVISIAFLSNGDTGIKNSIEVVFRTTLASVFGFLLSSNIKKRSKKKNLEIEKIKSELNKVQKELDELEENNEILNSKCNLEDVYNDNDTNMVQIGIALIISIVCIIIINVLVMTNNLENVPAISQIRDLMCSAIGFLIGESGKK